MNLVSRSLLVVAAVVASAAPVLAKTALRARLPPLAAEDDVARELMAEGAPRDVSMPATAKPEFIEEKKYKTEDEKPKSSCPGYSKDLVDALKTRYPIGEDDVAAACALVNSAAGPAGDVVDNVTNILIRLRDALIELADGIIGDGDGDRFNENVFRACDTFCNLVARGRDFTCGCTCLSQSLGLGLDSLPVTSLCVGAGAFIDGTDFGDEADRILIDSIIKLLKRLSA